MLAASIMHHEINEPEYYDLGFMLLKDFREPLIFFQWKYSRNFCLVSNRDHLKL